MYASSIHVEGAKVLDSVYGQDSKKKKQLVTDSVFATTVAELRAETSPLEGVVYVVIDAGQEGSFLYDATDTTSVDNTGTVVVSVSGARFKRIREPGFVDVRWFGAKGDGVTDDTEAFNKAIGNGGVTVNVPAGTYLINADTKLPGQQYAGINVRDDTTMIINKHATLKARPTDKSLFQIINIYGRKNVTVKGGGNVIGERDQHLGTTGEGGMGIAVKGSDRVCIQDLYIANCWGDGALISTLGAQSSSNVLVQNVHFYNNRRQGVTVGGADDVVLLHCIFEKTNGTNPQSGVDIEPNAGDEAFRIRVASCLFKDNAKQALILNAMNGPVRDVQIDDNRFLGLQRAIQSQRASEVKIRGNMINVSRTGVFVRLCTDVLVEGNMVKNIDFSGTDNSGIEVQASSAVHVANNQLFNVRGPALKVTDARHCTLANNKIEECGQESNKGDILLDSASSYNHIHGNSVRNRLKHAGAAKAATAGTLQLADEASAEDNAYKDMLVFITKGMGIGQKRTITSFSGVNKIAQCSPNWSTVPDSTSEYEIRYGSIDAIHIASNTEMFNRVENNQILFATITQNSTGLLDLGLHTSISENHSFDLI
ncbi:right-handed parallel beta-helix repeat-containing protein [Paenibacillus hodogayensis]|uniref:Right-handed parallel beta-helix repeat-containing protein n=1 Tax=Paenibacillus hodogayensis TaxID=279208 RepID=A0ABV5W711_9BACL